MAQRHEQTGRRLAPLLDGIALAALNPPQDVPPDLTLCDLTLDSRSAVAGGAFLACRGINSHGLDHLAPAVAAGVRAVLWETGPGVAAPTLPPGVFGAGIDGLGRQVGVIADRFFAGPSRQMRIAGITGTNGKTTVSWLLAQALDAAGTRAGYAGTLGYGAVRQGTLRGNDAAAHTTPDCISVHRHLSDLQGAGVRAVGMEVSSHALAQHRVDAVRFDTAVFTNLSRDHLDYHGSMQAYGAAKAALFVLPDVRLRILNMGDEFGRALAQQLRAQHPAETSVGVWPSDTTREAGRFVQARAVHAGADGLQVQFESTWGPGVLSSRLIGDFNAENLLLTLAVLLSWGIALPDALAALQSAKPAPGRMEAFRGAGRPLAVVDYAHSPDALAKALRALRRHCPGRLWCVFGCGGERDAGKRPMMGALAAQLADEVLLTDDNPRAEDPLQIVREIAAGMPADKPPRILRDRAQAIAAALDEAGPQDAVLVAGKGHEEFQVIGTERRPFSDRDLVRALQGRAA